MPFRRSSKKIPSDSEVAGTFRALMEVPESLWLVAEDQQVVAVLNAEFRRREETWCLKAHRVCYLGGIVVASAFRRGGVARALLTTLKQKAAARGVSQIELDVWGVQ